MFRHLNLTRFLPLLLLLPGVVVEAQRPPRGRRAAANRTPAAPECRVFCSDAKPGTSVAELVWRASGTPLDAGALESRLAEQGLEVTVYKDGYRRGRYASLPSVTRGREFLIQPLPPGAHPRVPALERLVVAEVYAVKDRLTRQRLAEGRSDLIAVRVEGLESGVNYYWRVPAVVNGRRVTSGVVRCQAATCPVDSQPAPGA
ncbi:MAG TPA: hypothetical protein VG148_01120 [Pyrinomonadaceae bacterium]|nr:hypothetical protein [Pyrinomonadaceae bacterium]